MNTAMLVDAEYLRQEAHTVLDIKRSSLDATFLDRWAREDGINHIRWYDGYYKTSHPHSNNQRHFFDCLARNTGIKLRMGSIVERDSSLFERAMFRMLPAVARDLGIAEGPLEEVVRRHWVSRTYRQQKGVDALYIIDILQLAQSSKVQVLCLCTGDRDFIPAIHEAQQLGVCVNLVVPRPDKVSAEIARVVDRVCLMPHDVLAKVFKEDQ